MASADPAAIDPDAKVRRLFVTPEGVDLGLRIGEASERAAAFLLDAAIIMGSLIVLTLVCILAFIGAGAGEKAGEWIAIIWLIGFFCARNVYFIAFEMGPRAATPGKKALGLRVAARRGGRLGADAIFARNAMREIEVYLPLTFLLARGRDVDAWIILLGCIWCGVFALFPLFNHDRLRIGDLVAGTWVVKTARRKLLPDLVERGSGDARFSFSPAQVDAYGVKELHVLEDVLRRNHLPTVAAVAERIRAKIGWTRGQDEADWAFLDAYYVALRRRLETRMLLGKRRKDKFDLG